MSKSSIIRAINAFFGDRRGTGSVEFVIALPLILIAQALAFDLGRVLMERHALESGVRDATRYLARSNITDCPSPGDYTYEVFKRLVVNGMRSPITPADIDCSFTTVFTSGGTSFRTDYVVIDVRAEVDVRTPLIQFIVPSISVAALDRARHIGQ